MAQLVATCDINTYRLVRIRSLNPTLGNVFDVHEAISPSTPNVHHSVPPVSPWGPSYVTDTTTLDVDGL